MNENGFDNNEYYTNEQIRRDSFNNDIERRNQADTGTNGDVSHSYRQRRKLSCVAVVCHCERR